jgi:hypothetical protein
MTKVIDAVEAKRLQGEIMQRMRRYGGKGKLNIRGLLAKLVTVLTKEKIDDNS